MHKPIGCAARRIDPGQQSVPALGGNDGSVTALVRQQG
jgi:hypothetical protein